MAHSRTIYLITNLSTPAAVVQLSWREILPDVPETNLHVNREYETDNVLMNVMTAASTFLILTVNSYVLYWIKHKNQTLIDIMIVQDCVGNIGCMVCFFFHFPRLIWHNEAFCIFRLMVTQFFTSLNRALPLTIATYRYFLVCHAERAEMFGKKKFAKLLNIVHNVVTILITIGVGLVVHTSRAYMVCIGIKGC